MTSYQNRLGLYLLVVIIIVIALMLLTWAVFYLANLIPTKFELIFNVILAAGVGVVVITVLVREIRRAGTRLFGERTGGMLSSAFRYFAYVVLALIILSLAGVNGTSLLIGGTFAGLVVGLASQTVLSNVFAGLLLLTSRPFGVGDRVTLTTWQYGIVVPSYPPKFFSDDRLIVGFTGIVRDIGLIYSDLALDEGPTIKIPNGVLIQAAIISQRVEKRTVSVRYQAPKISGLKVLLNSVKEAVANDQWVVDPSSVRVYVQNIMPEYYLILVQATCKGDIEEPPRTSLYITIDECIQRMSIKRG
jgi:small conductance mechanosensitive channel